jgi:hypothetical protein
MNINKYNDFLSEAALSSVSAFLKAQYNNIFKGANQQLNNLFTTFTKKVDTEKNVSNLYQRYVRANQTALQNEINVAETTEAVNKLVADNIKLFYFSLKPIVNKLQNDEFTMEKVFERSRDKTLMKLMSYPEDQFANAVQEYVNQSVIPQIKKGAGIVQTPQEQQQTQTPQNQPAATTEKIKRYDTYKILEADDPNQVDPNKVTPDEELVKYKKSAINWFNLSIFDLLKPKWQLLNQLRPNTVNAIEQVSKMMKSTNNENAKKMILNNIVNMSKEELQNLANTIGITKEELGQL